MDSFRKEWIMGPGIQQIGRKIGRLVGVKNLVD